MLNNLFNFVSIAVEFATYFAEKHIYQSLTKDSAWVILFLKWIWLFSFTISDFDRDAFLIFMK